MFNRFLTFSLIICWFQFISANNDDDTVNIEKYIKNSIFNSEYDRTIRPSVTVKISMDIALKQIIALDERNQVMITASYLFASWNDSRLKWNSTKTKDVKTISVGARNLWLPDLYITNTAEQNGFISITDTNIAFVQSDGLVYLTLSLISN